MPLSPRFQLDGSIASIFVGDAEQSRIDLDRPAQLEFEYMQQMDAVTATAFSPPVPIRAAHIGACGCALAWSWHLQRDQSRQIAFEIDAELAANVREWLPLPRKPHLKIRAADGREAMEQSKAHFDVIVRDAFAGTQIPASLQAIQFVNTVKDRLASKGLYLANCAHGGSTNGRADIAAIATVFPNAAIIGPSKTLKGARWGNLIAIGWTDALTLDLAEVERKLRHLPLPASIISGKALDRWLGGQQPASD